MAVRLAVERAQLSNSMAAARSSMSSSSANVLELPRDRRNAQDKELRAILDRVDPQAEGHISLPSVKRTLKKLLPPPTEDDRKQRSKNGALCSDVQTKE